MTATTATQDNAGRNGIGGNTGPNTRHWRAPQFFELPADEAAQLRQPLLSEEKPVNPFNGGPDLEGQKQSIRTRWAKALFADPDTPTYVIAMAWVIHWYSRNDGTGAAISNQQFQDICSISQPTATKGKKWLRDNGYVQLIVGKGDEKTQFRIVVPDQPSADDGVKRGYTQPQTTQPRSTQHQAPLYPRVERRLQHIQERDSGDIQDNKKTGGNPFWKQHLNPEDPDYQVGQDGTVVLVNGARSRWLLEFGDDTKRLELALKQISPYVQRNSPKGLKVQVEGQLARLAAEKHDKDRRYNQSARTKGAAPATDDFNKIDAIVGRRR